MHGKQYISVLVFCLLFFMGWAVWNHMWDDHFNYYNCKERGEQGRRRGERVIPMNVMS